MALAITEDGRTFFVPDEELKMEITPEMLEAMSTDDGDDEVKGYWPGLARGPFRQGTSLYNITMRAHDGVRSGAAAARRWNDAGHFRR